MTETETDRQTKDRGGRKSYTDSQTEATTGRDTDKETETGRQ